MDHFSAKSRAVSLISSIRANGVFVRWCTAAVECVFRFAWRFKSARAVASYTLPLSQVMREVGISVTDREVSRSFSLSTDESDLVSLVRVARRYGVDLVAVRAEQSRLKELPLPSLLVEDDGGLIAIFRRNGEAFSVFDLRSGFRNCVTAEITNRWSGVAFLVDGNSQRYARPPFSFALRRFADLLPLLGPAGIPCAIALLGLLCIQRGSGLLHEWGTLAALCITATGLIVSLLMVSEHYSSGGTLLSKVCSAGQAGTGSCSEVLESPYSRVIGVPWAALGVVFFAASFLMFFLSDVPLVPVGTAALACVPCSLYLLWVLSRERMLCVFCLLIHGIVFFLAYLFCRKVLFAFGATLSIYWRDFGSFLLCCLLGILAISLVQLWFRASESKNAALSVLRAPNVFAGLLTAGTKIPVQNCQSDLVLASPKRPNNAWDIVLVLSPSCGPCLSLLDSLVAELMPVVHGCRSFRIRFVTFEDEKDAQENENSETALLSRVQAINVASGPYEALSHLYGRLARGMDHQSDASPHGSLLENWRKEVPSVVEAASWFKACGLRATPCVIVNGVSLPEDCLAFIPELVLSLAVSEFRGDEKELLAHVASD